MGTNPRVAGILDLFLVNVIIPSLYGKNDLALIPHIRALSDKAHHDKWIQKFQFMRFQFLFSLKSISV